MGDSFVHHIFKDHLLAIHCVSGEIHLCFPCARIPWFGACTFVRGVVLLLGETAIGSQIFKTTLLRYDEPFDNEAWLSEKWTD